MNTLELLTHEDLVRFQDELMGQLKEMLHYKAQPEWLRSKDVRKMLGISDSTLQTLRINGSIPAYKLGDSWFYKYDEIQKALEQGKVKGGKHE